MSEKENKYLSVGSIVNLTTKAGEEYKMITLDNLNLKDFVDLLQKHGATHLAGKTPEQIKAGQKDGSIPRVQISMFDVGDKAPESVKKMVFKNLAVKLR